MYEHFEWRTQTGKGGFAGRTFHLRVALLMLSMATCDLASAQSGVVTVRVQIFDGRTGRAIVDTPVALHDLALRGSTPARGTTDPDGVAFIQLLPGAVVRPFAFGMFTCSKTTTDMSAPAAGIDYPVSTIMAQGIVAKNRCNRYQNKPLPGTLTLYFRPLHWWEKIHD